MSILSGFDYTSEKLDFAIKLDEYIAFNHKLVNTIHLISGLLPSVTQKILYSDEWEELNYKLSKLHANDVYRWLSIYDDAAAKMKKMGAPVASVETFSYDQRVFRLDEIIEKTDELNIFIQEVLDIYNKYNVKINIG